MSLSGGRYLMKVNILIFAMGLFLAVSGCAGGLSGTVVDDETGKPLDGAVVLVEWTITKGLPGLSYGGSYKVMEAITDREGKFAIPRALILDPRVESPHLTIYKKDYVAWNNEYIFPGYDKREDFCWHSGYVFRMKRFKEGLSFIEHQSFIDGMAHPEQATEGKKVFLKAYEAWEREKVIEERQNINNRSRGSQ
jgi:hypothetical protein